MITTRSGKGSPLTYTELDTNFTDLAGKVGVSVKDYGAVGDGTTDDSTAINNAITALNSTTGGLLIFENGKTYKISQSLMIVDRHNVTLFGDNTTLLATASPTPNSILWNNTNLGYGGSITYGIVTVDSTATTIATTPTSNIKFIGLTFKSDYNESGNGKTLFIGAATDVYFSKCTFYGTNVEDLYHHGHNYLGTEYASHRVTVRDCYFPSTNGDCITSNSSSASQWIVTNNYFDACLDSAVHLIGDDMAVYNNTFYRVKGWNIELGEGTSGGKGNLAANNTLIEPGYGSTSETVLGIYVVNDPSKNPRGNKVIGNIIRDMVAGGTTYAIQARGNADIIGNTISGVSGNSTNAGAVAVGSSSGVTGGGVYHIYDNILEDTELATHFENGLIILNGTTTGDLTTVFTGGNYWGDKNTGKYRIFVADNASGKFPNLYIMGDIANGYVIGRKGQITNPLNSGSVSLDNVPLWVNNVNKPPIYVDDFGDDGTGITYFTNGDTTPNVYGRGIARTNNSSPTTITNFTGAPMGMELTIIFTDTNTTVANGTSIKLSGATNFTSTVNDTLTLIQTGSVWVEKCRSVN